jgi:CRP-like cAMP-binding protein
MYLKLGKFARLLLKFLEILTWLAIYIHLLACLWNFVVGINEEWQPFALIEPGSDFFHLDLPKRYALCIYTIVASICRFEMLPSNEVEYIFLAFSVILGTLFTSILYGSIIVILQNLGKNSEKFIEEHEKISKTLKNLKLPKSLKKEVKTFFRHSFNLIDQEHSYQKLLGILPPSIKKKLNSNIFGGLFTKNSLFENKRKIVSYLIRELEHRFVQPDELIIKQFDSGKDLFFVNSGKFQVEILDQVKDLHQVKSLGPGSLFGEVAMIFNTTRSASVRSTEYSTLAQLPSEKLSNLFTKFPSFKTVLIKGLSLYKDPYRVFIEKTLSKLKYLHGLDSASFSTLVYSLPIYSCPADSELFTAGQTCQSVFLLLEGNVKVMFEVQGPQISQQIRRKSVKMSIKNAARVRAANLVIEELGQGSVIGSTLLILQQKFVVTARCTAQTRVMVFSRSHLDELMLKFPSVKLAVEDAVAKMKTWDHIMSRESFKRIPLDYYKCTKYLASHLQVKNKTQKIRTLFKNLVIEKILAFREWKIMKKPGIKVVLNRLKALVFLQGKGKKELEFLICNGKIQPEIAYACDLIGNQELNPLVAQFAIMAKETGKLSGIFQERMKELRKELEMIKGNSEGCLVSVGKLTKIYEEIEKYLKK